MRNPILLNLVQNNEQPLCPQCHSSCVKGSNFFLCKKCKIDIYFSSMYFVINKIGIRLVFFNEYIELSITKPYPDFYDTFIIDPVSSWHDLICKVKTIITFQ